MRIKEKAALITGGARGIGATTALLFAAEGASVGIVDVREEELQDIAAKAERKDLELKTFVGDITQKDQIEGVVDRFVQAFGRIDILVNNAGIVIPRPFFESRCR